MKVAQNIFTINISCFLFIDSYYDYTLDYIENVARNFTRKYPSYLIHKKSEDKIKAFLTDTVKAKVETFADAEAKKITVTEVREIADLIAEYEGMEGERKSSSPFGNHPMDAPSLGSTGVELAMSMDNGGFGYPSHQCSQTYRCIGKTQDNETKCNPCNRGVGSADGNQTIPAFLAGTARVVQPA